MRRGPVSIIVLIPLWVFACGEIREDEVWCEAAVARLHDCCAGLDPARLSCVHHTGCNDDQAPTFSQRGSECIVDRSCDALVTNGVCKRVIEEQRVPYPLRDGTLRDSEVCK